MLVESMCFESTFLGVPLHADGDYMESSVTGTMLAAWFLPSKTSRRPQVGSCCFRGVTVGRTAPVDAETDGLHQSHVRHDSVPRVAHVGPTRAWLPVGKYRRDAPPPEGARLTAWKEVFSRIGVERSWTILEPCNSRTATRDHGGGDRRRVAARQASHDQRPSWGANDRPARREPSGSGGVSDSGRDRRARSRLGTRLGLALRNDRALALVRISARHR
jgi:hypothetical protein